MVRALKESFCDVSDATVGEKEACERSLDCTGGKKEQRTVFLRGAETSAAPGWLSILLLLSATDTGLLLVLAGSTREARIQAWRSQKARI